MEFVGCVIRPRQTDIDRSCLRLVYGSLVLGLELDRDLINSLNKLSRPWHCTVYEMNKQNKN